MIRPAALKDVPELVRIEAACFETDRLSRRQFRHLLTEANAATLVEARRGGLAGYAAVLFHAGTSLARLYSMAVRPDQRGGGVGAQLLAGLEAAAHERGCAWMRLEVRPDNAPAVALYEAAGYRRFGVYEDYYEDHADALRMEKRLAGGRARSASRVPYYRQTLDFTCGPAALMMAMRALDREVPLDRKHELRLWRESTTIFMTAGHGGCGPYGLALAAGHRGFDVEIVVNDDAALFVDSVRSEEKKEVIRLVQEDMLEEIAGTQIRVRHGRVGVDELERAFRDGAVPVVLISSYRIYHEKSPHWVVVTAFDRHFIYVHDPFVDEEKERTVTDCVNLPIARRDFERIARYGRAQQKAVLFLRKRRR